MVAKDAWQSIYGHFDMSTSNRKQQTISTSLYVKGKASTRSNFDAIAENHNGGRCDGQALLLSIETDRLMEHYFIFYCHVVSTICKQRLWTDAMAAEQGGVRAMVGGQSEVFSARCVVQQGGEQFLCGAQRIA